MIAIGGSSLDPLLWAKKPKSALAFSYVLDLVEKGDERFREILTDLQRQGITDGEKLLKRWDGQQWVTA